MESRQQVGISFELYTLQTKWHTLCMTVFQNQKSFFVSDQNKLAEVKGKLGFLT